MPKYSFKCSDCSFEEIVDATIPEYLSISESNVSETVCSKDCLYKNKRLFKDVSFFETEDSLDSLNSIKAEARRIAEKVRDGDLKSIEDICGQ
tara:strand:- start:436 stop:714 length:279 start_codon:yes stop_codon:yes gene_type:complete